MDLVGTLIGTVDRPNQLIKVANDAECRLACCNRTGCTAYAFASGVLEASVGADAAATMVAAPCGLYADVTALVPSTLFSSGALLSVYS